MANKNVIIAGVAVVVVAAGAYFFIGSKGISTGGSSASSSCTMEEYASKAQSVQTQVVKLQQKDPAAFQKAMVKMQEIGQKMAQNPNDFSAACAALDEILKAVKD